MKKNYLILIAVIGMAIFNSCKKDTPAPTNLELTITDEQGYVIPGASVFLYSSLTDWVNGTNQIGSTVLTNSDGNAIFNNLSSTQQYYWYVKADCRDNNNGIYTAVLTAHVNNYVPVSVTGTSTIEIQNTSMDPYLVYINNDPEFTINSGIISDVTEPTGLYTVKVIDITYGNSTTFTGTLNCSTAIIVCPSKK